MRAGAAAIAILLAAGCWRGPSAVFDQRPQRETTGVVSGLVRDARGVPIAGVAVMASSAHGRSMALTDDRGRYVIRHLVPGDYEVTFDPCQVDSQTERVEVVPGQGATVDIRLGAPAARVAPVPTPRIAGGDSDAKPAPPTAGAGPRAEDRRQLLADAAADADEIWIIARTAGRRAKPQARRRYAAGLMCAYVPGSGKDVPLPLGKTDVRAHVSGHVAAVDVEQRYVNPFREKIEAVYVFPLPEAAAVGEFVMTIGNRRIRGIVREHDEAQRIYDEARAGGYVAALLTQQRPNVFTQRVANIEPGFGIDVKLTYYHLLPYRDGAYTFAFPTVVGPRYSPPGTPDGIGAVHVGHEGQSRQPNEVTYLARGATSKRRFSMTVELDAGVKVEAIESPNYAIRTEKITSTRHRVTLAAGSAQPNKDYVLRYKVAGDRMKSGFMVGEGSGDRYFSFILQPPEDLAERAREPIELMIVADRSGSMKGDPARTARRAVQRLIDRLEPEDRFRLVVRDGDRVVVGGLATPSAGAAQRALAALDRASATGTTDLVDLVAKALAAPRLRGRERVVALVTDGYSGDERRLVRLLQAGSGKVARVLAVGVGTAVNRFLMERIARVTSGAAIYLDTGDDAAADRELSALLSRLSHPVMSDIRLDFGDMNIREVYPAKVPDLLVGQPVIVTGKLRGAVGKRVKVIGTVRGQRIAYDLTIRPSAVAARKELANLWARMKIDDLRDQMPGLAEELRRLARRHGLVSPATAILGIDASKRTEGGAAKSVKVPVPLPEGVGTIEP